ncbi:MAG TPA: hypothetical protein VMZ91_15975 [Candidatus Paceibacterota bacterium]|nr:hypothetical protein [Candidatus Paceibacterota bacterium]
MIYCEKCNSNKKVEEHHIHPKFMDNKNGNGIKINLCKKHHIILHLIIPSILWKFIKESDKPTVIEQVKNLAIKYSQTQEILKDKKTLEFKHNEDNKQRCPNCERKLDFEDFIEGVCNCCFSPLKIKEDDLYEYL